MKTSPAFDFFCLIFQEVGVFLRWLLLVRVSSYWKYVYKNILYLKLKTGIGSCMFRFSLVYWQTCYFQTFDDVITNNCYHGNSKALKMSFQIQFGHLFCSPILEHFFYLHRKKFSHFLSHLMKSRWQLWTCLWSP